MGLVLSAGPAPSLPWRQMPAGAPAGVRPSSAALMPEALPRSEPERQGLLALASDGVRRDVWDSRYGPIVIEVHGEDVFVNGRRVEPHAA